MSNNLFAQLQETIRTGGASAVFDELAQVLRGKKDYHKLFDALCLKKKYELGAPLFKPTSFDDVPVEKRDDFETAYVAAAREVAMLLLADKKLSQSFVYFHAVSHSARIQRRIGRIDRSGFLQTGSSAQRNADSAENAWHLQYDYRLGPGIYEPKT